MYCLVSVFLSRLLVTQWPFLSDTSLLNALVKVMLLVSLSVVQWGNVVFLL